MDEVEKVLYLLRQRKDELENMIRECSRTVKQQGGVYNENSALKLAEYTIRYNELFTVINIIHRRNQGNNVVPLGEKE